MRPRALCSVWALLGPLGFSDGMNPNREPRGPVAGAGDIHMALVMHTLWACTATGPRHTHTLSWTWDPLDMHTPDTHIPTAVGRAHWVNGDVHTLS